MDTSTSGLTGRPSKPRQRPRPRQRTGSPTGGHQVAVERGVDSAPHHPTRELDSVAPDSVLPEMPQELVEQLAACLARALVAAIRRDPVAMSETGTTSTCGTVGVDAEGTTTPEANP